MSDSSVSTNRPQEALATVSEGIALLIELAERGEIDPWDVQVIDVIDRYLSQLVPAHDRSTTDANLSQSGQAFLYASMLVLLKAESLVLWEESGEESSDDLGQYLEAESMTQERLPLQLERQLRRRAVAPVPRRRQVTLPELIAQLQLMAATIQEKTPTPRPRRPGRIRHQQAAKAIAELAHQENLVETATELDQFLREHATELEGFWLDIEELLERWKNRLPETNLTLFPLQETSVPKKDRVGVFWALLLLSAQSKVELVQEEFYQDLKIRPLFGEECVQILPLAE